MVILHIENGFKLSFFIIRISQSSFKTEAVISRGSSKIVVPQCSFLLLFENCLWEISV